MLVGLKLTIIDSVYYFYLYREQNEEGISVLLPENGAVDCSYFGLYL